MFLRQREGEKKGSGGSFIPHIGKEEEWQKLSGLGEEGSKPWENLSFSS